MRYTNLVKSKCRAEARRRDYVRHCSISLSFSLPTTIGRAAALAAVNRPIVQRTSKKVFVLPKAFGECYEGSIFGRFSHLLFLSTSPSANVPDTLPVRYPNLHKVRLIHTKRIIALVVYIGNGSTGVAKDTLLNIELDGVNEIDITFARK